MAISHFFWFADSEPYHGAGRMGTPTGWLFGDAPDGRLLGTLTFGQLFGVRFDFFRFLLSSLV